MKQYIQLLKQTITNSSVSTLLNDNHIKQVNAQIRNYLPADELKLLGAFFTEDKLATGAIRYFKYAITAESVVLDPHCGVGSLLIESSRQLGVCYYLSDTLKQWGKVLWGFDIKSDFITITKLRLIMEALARGAQLDCSIELAMGYFEHIIEKNAETILPAELVGVTHLFMNPPFVAIASPLRDYWGKGKTNSAAVFFDYYLRHVPDKCNVVAILPDVLRSGSRFIRFREFVSQNMQGKVDIWGRFSEGADIDVFILSGYRTKSHLKIKWAPDSHLKGEALSLQYDVCIGPLVAYRDEQVGNIYPYFHSKNCKNWETVTNVSERRAFNGKVIQPPCVLIKRTSSPSDQFRAAATLIDLKEPVAVENHMIVVTAKDGSLRSCKRLLKMLAKPEINQFLNEQIRARHLTVGVVKAIPLLF